MNTIWNGRDDVECSHCIFCGVAENQLLASYPPRGHFDVPAWPARYAYPSCVACEQAGEAHWQVVVAGAAALANAVNPEDIDETLHDALCDLAGRLAKAVFYDRQGHIFPYFGAIYFYWDATEAPLVADSSVESMLDQWNTPESIQSGSPELDRQFALDVAYATGTVAIQARIAGVCRVLVFADMSPDRLGASTHGLYDLLPGGLHQAQPGLYE